MLQFIDQRVPPDRSFEQVRRSETYYSQRLRRLALHIRDLIHDFVLANDWTPETLPFNSSALERLLLRYANTLHPWATAVATRMLRETAQRDVVAWRRHSRNMWRQLQQEVQEAPLAQALEELKQQQIELITSLPTRAAELIHRITVENVISGRRYEDLVQVLQAERYPDIPTAVRRRPEYVDLTNEILDVGSLTRSRAMLIARTETARVASTITQVRAQHIGSPGYFWRTMRDSRVRDTHKVMGERSGQGEMFRWDDPPLVEPLNGKHYHPGMTFNCRCYAEPIVPDRYDVR